MDWFFWLAMIALGLATLWFIGSWIVFIALAALVARVQEHLKD